jgi:2-dehydropantoate 2-reductase
MKLNKICLIGLGAIGGSVYDPLSRVADIKVIATGERAERLKKNGVIINGKNFKINLADEIADLIIIAVKYHDIPQTLLDVKPFVGEKTIILPLLNGIDSRGKIAAEFGEEKVLFGLTTASAVKTGNVVNHSPQGVIKFGAAKNSEPFAPGVLAVKELLDAAGINNAIRADMVYETWFKFLLNVSGNTVNTLLRGPHAYFQKYQTANDARRLIMREVVALSKAMGTGLEETDIEKLMPAYNDYPPENINSTLQDLLAKKRTENEMMCGTVARLAEQYGVPTPVTKFAYLLLETLDRVNIKG